MKRAALLLLMLVAATQACSLPGLPAADPSPSATQAISLPPNPTATISATPTAAPSHTPLPAAGEDTHNDPPTPTLQPSPTPTPTPQFHIWSSQQALDLLAALKLKIGEARPAQAEDLLGAPMLAAEALVFDLSAYCRGCSGLALSFTAPGDLEAIRNFYAALGEQRLIAKDNLLLHLDNRLSRSQALRFQQALEENTLASVLEAYNHNLFGFESWQEYYPTDRGQQTDPAKGRAQRTYNRWEGDGLWYFGQSTWRYQAPDGSASPPAFFPAAYGDQPLHYFYNYQCEPRANQDPSKDCLNWQIYIELLGNTDDPTLLMNWARGGWKAIRRKPAEWEVFYRPEAFGGVCEKAHILANYDDATLQDPENKAPLLFRLPDRVGATYAGPDVCAVIFNNYIPRTKFIRQVESWRPATHVIAKTYDPATQRYVIQAENRYYKIETRLDGDALYSQWALEMYWVRQVKPDQPLRDGFEAFWWFSWKQPPEENLDRDHDTTWSDFQWCRVDTESGPDGLGVLVCE